VSTAAAVLETTDAGGKGIGTDEARGWVLVYEPDEAEDEPRTTLEGDPVVAAGVSMSTVVEFVEGSTGLLVLDERGAVTLLT
jgi:hypothetical protein